MSTTRPKESITVAPALTGGQLLWALKKESSAGVDGQKWASSPRVRPSSAAPLSPRAARENHAALAAPSWRPAAKGRPQSARATVSGAGLTSAHQLHFGTGASDYSHALRARPPPVLSPAACAAVQAAQSAGPSGGPLPNFSSFPPAKLAELLGGDAATNTSVEGARSLLEGFKAKAPELGQGLSGRGVQAWMQEAWSELHAWCGFLASNLEGSCRRIELLGEERRLQDAKLQELRGSISFLEHLCGTRNIHALEQRVEAQQAVIDDFDSVRAELSEALEKLQHTEERRCEQQAATSAAEAAKADTERELGEAMAETARLMAEAQAEAARAAEAEAAVRRHREEAEQALEQVRLAKEKQRAAEAARRKGDAEFEAKLNAAAAGHNKASSLAAAEHEKTRAELAHVKQLLAVESAARTSAEQRAKHARAELDAALRACKQSDDRARAERQRRSVEPPKSRNDAPTPRRPVEPVIAAPTPAPPPARAPPVLSKTMSSAAMVANMVMGSPPRTPSRSPTRAPSPSPAPPAADAEALREAEEL